LVLSGRWFCTDRRFPIRCAIVKAVFRAGDDHGRAGSVRYLAAGLCRDAPLPTRL
jgi:hypothetical protein